MSRPPPRLTLFPYTTLFRSGRDHVLFTQIGVRSWKGNDDTIDAMAIVARHVGHARLLIVGRSEEHTSELQSHSDLVCRLLLEKKKIKKYIHEPGHERANCST